MSGTILFFNESRKYGFIRDDIGEEHFFHISGFKNGILPSGTAVVFELSTFRGQPVACQIEKLKV